MLRRSSAALTKLVIVESPNKVIKIEGLLSNAKVVADWSFNDSELRTISSGPEKASAMATAGHFMSLKELTWTPQTRSAASAAAAAAAAATNDSFPVNGVLASFALEWELVPGRKVQETVTHYVKEKLRDISEIIVATDPDREGELIAVHTLHLIRSMFPSLSVPFTRAYIHSITEDGVRTAMRERRRDFDIHLANAAEARHAMDRIFGFLGSSVVRYANPQMRSIGRVQTPALILIKEREDKIQQYMDVHKTVYEVRCLCHFPARQGRHFTQLCVVRPQSPRAATTTTTAAAAMTSAHRVAADALAAHEMDWANETAVQELLQRWQLEKAHSFVVADAPPPQLTVTPPPLPFTMATLIAKANRQLRLSSEVVSSCLQDLFQMGYITYPRTDSSRIDDTVLPSIYSAVCAQYGKAALYRLGEREDGGNDKGGKGGDKARWRAHGQHGGRCGDAPHNVEDAHEAIRPTNIQLCAADLGAMASNTKQVYELIRRNTLAAFMRPLKTERVCVTVHFTAGNDDRLMLQLVGKHTREPGWTAAFRRGDGGDKVATAAGDATTIMTAAAAAEGSGSDDAGLDAAAADEGVAVVPSVSEDEFAALVALRSMTQSLTRRGSSHNNNNNNNNGNKGASGLRLESWQVAEHKPTPPLPYLEGALIEELKKHGVGRPSTYPMIVKTLLARNYIVVNKGRCETTPVGRLLVDTSRAMFPSIVDIHFTASFEKQLDHIAKPDTALSSCTTQTTTGTGGDDGEDAAASATRAAVATVSGDGLTIADYVLSSFVSRFLNYVTEATRTQRSLHVARTLRATHEQQQQAGDEQQPPRQQEQQSVCSNDDTTASHDEVVERERQRAVALVPDLLESSRNYRTFTALQNNLHDYLRRYFPPPPPSSSASAQGHSAAAATTTTRTRYGGSVSSSSSSHRRSNSKGKQRATAAFGVTSSTQQTRRSSSGAVVQRKTTPAARRSSSSSSSSTSSKSSRRAKAKK